MQRKAVITGVSGQDGSYLAELLLSKGYAVHGFVRRTDVEDPHKSLWRLTNILDKIVIHPVSIESYPSILNTIEKIQPDECYHLAAQSFVSYAIEDEYSIFNTNINGTHNILSVLIRVVPKCRFYFAGSSEQFGNAASSPQDENTQFHPRSAYGITKVTGYHLTNNYREKYNMFACNGILYNHESPRRGFEYVTRKITYGISQIKLGLIDKIMLGNLDAIRDWGYSKDYVFAMWLMLQQTEPKDYVIASGEGHTVREFCDIAFSRVNLDYRDYVITDERFYRPSEKVPLIGDNQRAIQYLGWSKSLSFSELVQLMVDEDCIVKQI